MASVRWRGGACPLVALFLVAGGAILLLLARGDAALLGEPRRAVGLIFGDGHDHRGRMRIADPVAGFKLDPRPVLELPLNPCMPEEIVTSGIHPPLGNVLESFRWPRRSASHPQREEC